MEDSGLSFEIIKPLIVETADKVQSIKPYDAQTGPAVRYDEVTIKKHIYMLNRKSEFRKLYKLLAKGIFNVVSPINISNFRFYGEEIGDIFPIDDKEAFQTKAIGSLF